MVQLIEKIKDTAGGFHSWWKSDVGIIRKPNNNIKLKPVQGEPKPMQEEAKPMQKISWFKKILNWLKVVFLKIKTKLC